MFTLNSIRFYEGCKYLKNLHTGEDYPLKHRLDKNFFAPKICISAIVGQNGSGKSSLLDMIFRVINNLSYCLFNKVEREASASLSYITNIQADLTFNVNNKTGAVRVRDGILGFEFGKLKCKFIVYKPENKNLSEVEDTFHDYADYTNPSFKQQKEVTKAFFYTVATNYSIQSFIAQDYSQETAISMADNKPEKTIHPGSWLNNLFHKNDGYLSPVVLNPYRDNGWLDMGNEEHLTTSRLAALLIEEDPKHSLLDGYSFDDMACHWKPRRLQEKFTSIIDDRVKLYPSKLEVEEHNRYYIDVQNHWQYKENEDLKDFRDFALQKSSYAHVILAALRCSVNRDMNPLQLYVRMYVVYKVLSVAEKYPSYIDFKKYGGNINYTFHSLGGNNKYETIAQLKKLAKTVKNDQSHIGLKLRQALNFIKKSTNLGESDFPEVISYKQYAKLLNIEPKGMTIKKRMEWLPPGIFKSEISLKNQKTNAKVYLNQLSSGERQFIYLTSTILYHAMNLGSIPKNGTRIRYNRLNFILDEVEICFHPEYQRQFVKKLRDLFVRVNLNKSFDINVLITTHSPFILSDIHKDNILCLEEGKVCCEVFKQTFCSNIYDLLNNQFFMKQFVGDIAAEKLDSLVQELNQLLEKHNNHSKTIPEKRIKYLQNQINMIGDEFIRIKLLEKLKPLKEDDPIKAEYEMLRERIRIVKEKMKRPNDTNRI